MKAYNDSKKSIQENELDALQEQINVKVFTILTRRENGIIYIFNLEVEKARLKSVRQTIFEQTSSSTENIEKAITDLGIRLTDQQKYALISSESVRITSDSSYIEVLSWYAFLGLPYGAYSHLHLSAIDAVNIDVAINAAIALFALLTVLLLETLIGAAVCAVVTFLAAVIKIDYEALYRDHNSDGLF